jgi:hypothetical protein
LKNTHLLRYAHPSSLQRTTKYASFLRISRALHLDVFDQPEKNYFFNTLIVVRQKAIVAGETTICYSLNTFVPVASLFLNG